MKTKRAFAKCPTRGCKSHRVFTVAVRMLGSHPMVGVLTGDAVTWAQDPSYPRKLREVGAHCDAHGVPMRLRLLKAAYVADVDCTDKCRSAVGPSCECSCAGRNHGSSHE